MSEIIFLVEDDPEGGYVARSIGASIFTQADNFEALKAMVRDAVECHFPDANQRPHRISLCRKFS